MNEQHVAASASDTAESSPRQLALAGVVQLSSGVTQMAGGFGRVVFLESAEHLDDAQTLCGPEGLVFSPDPGDRTEGVFTYEGALAEPGDESLVADELYVYTQDYLATPFLAVAGPTIVRISNEQDYEAFLQDADLAHEKGVFVEQLVNPAVFLADQCALGTTHSCAAVRLYVTADGDVRTAPGGPVLGTLESNAEELVRASATSDAEGDVCLNAVIKAQTLDRARAQRPWLSRYLRAIDVLRGLRANGRAGFQVSGFGRRLVEGLPAELSEANDSPLLLWNDDEYLICDALQERVFQLGSDAAKIIELLLVTGSSERACELATQHLSLDHDTALAAIKVISGALANTGILPNEALAS